MNTPPEDEFDHAWLERYRAASRAQQLTAGAEVSAAVQREARRVIASRRSRLWQWPAWSAVAAGLLAAVWVLPLWRSQKPLVSSAQTAPVATAVVPPAGIEADTAAPVPALPAAAATSRPKARAAPPSAPVSAPSTTDALAARVRASEASDQAATDAVPAPYAPALLREAPNSTAPSRPESLPSTVSGLMARAHPLESNAEAASGAATAGLALDTRDTDGRTALMRAAMSGDADLVAHLLQRGADPTLTDAHGQSALALARRYRRAAVIALLQRDGR